MKDKIFSVLQRVGRSFMLPIAILPVAGLLLGIGSSFTNATTIETYGLTSLLGNGTILHALLVIMNKVGSAVFDNLPLIFAVGVAIGMAKKEKEVSALSAVIAYFVMNTAINAMLTITGQILENGEIAESVLEGTITSVCGIQSLQMGVFGGIIVGLGVAALHNRFYRIQLPNALSFFGGTRFVPIISTIVYMFVGILMYFVWPVVQNGIYAPQDFFLHHRQNHSVKMIVVNLFSKFLGCRYIDFISVHNSRYDIISAEFFLDKMERFFVKLLCIFVAAVTLEVHRVHINHNLIEQRCVFS